MKEKLKDKKTWGYLIPTIALIGFGLFLYIKSDLDGGSSNGYKSVGYFNGGNGGSDLVVKKVRWHKHKGFERVVFDINKYNGMFSSKHILSTNSTGIYQIGKEKALSLELDGEFKGFRIFTSNLPSFYKSKLISAIEIYPEDSDAYLFTLKLKKPTSYKVFTLKNPARIIVDLKQ